MLSIRTLRLRVAGLLGLLLAWPVGAEDRPQSYLESLEVRVVNVEVYVTGRDGRPVEGLGARDFTLLEDGKKVKISNFSWVEGAGGEVGDAAGESPQAPPRIVLFFDNFAIQPQGRKLILDSLREMFDSGSQGDALYAVASYEGHLRMNQTFTRDAEAILDAVEESGRLTPLGALRDAEREAVLQQGLEILRSVVQIAEIGDIRGDQALRRLQAYTQQVDAQAERQRQLARDQIFALSHLANALGAFPGRKAIVYFSEGMPMRPGEELYAAIDETFGQARPDLIDYSRADSEQQDAALAMRSSALGALDQVGRSGGKPGERPTSGVQDLTAIANAGRVSFYTLKADIGEGGVPPEFGGEMRELFTPRLQGIRLRNLSATLSAMAEQTGGRSALGTGAAKLVTRAREDLDGYYFLGFRPEREADGAYHKLKVRVRGRGLDLRHRAGYLDKPAVAKLADRVTAALLLEMDDNPLGLELAFGPAEPGPRRELRAVPVLVSIPLAFLDGLPPGMQTVPAALLIAARDQEGRAAPVQQLPVELERGSEGGRHTTGFRLLMREGRQRLAVGLVVPAAGATAFVSGALEVEGGAGG